MNWKNCSWDIEDILYAPKRKVNNKNSRWHPHIIGSFYSVKNDCVVEYESLNEKLFYYYLELDSLVVRYYVQPVEVPICTHNNDWVHIPDVLVFRQFSVPKLYQIKENPQDQSLPKVMLINQFCQRFCFKKKWEYEVIFPKKIPPIVIRNLNFLMGFIKPREYYQDFYRLLVNQLKDLDQCTVSTLAEMMCDKLDPLFAKPLIYYLIAKNIFYCDIYRVINSESTIQLNQGIERDYAMPKGADFDDY